MNEPVLSVVIVTWNCRSFVDACLASLRNHVAVPSEIIVVDNSSADGTAEFVEQCYPEVQVIRSGGNLGFAKGNNLGIARSRGRYLALINPDVQLLDGCLDRVLETIEGDSSIAIVGPAMVGRDGRVHRSGMRLPSLWHCLCDALALNRLFRGRSFVGGQMMADFQWDTPRDIEVLNGWFWLIRRDALAQVGLLDEQFFMYGEDVDWCRRFRDAGWRLVFEPRARAIHYGGGSSQLAPMKFYIELQRANLQYWRKHQAAMAPAYRFVVALHHALRCAGFALKATLAPDARPLAREKLRRSARTLYLLALGRL